MRCKPVPDGLSQSVRLNEQTDPDRACPRTKESSNIEALHLRGQFLDKRKRNRIRATGSNGMASMTESADHTTLLDYATQIVAAYVTNNTVPAGELGTLIQAVHQALRALGNADVIPEKPVPAVSIKRSVTTDYIVCLEDGRKFKTLKRHLRVRYNMTPQEYREKWGLPPDYPMVAPSYAASRSAMAKTIGLGQKRTLAAPPTRSVSPTARPKANKSGARKRRAAAKT